MYMYIFNPDVFELHIIMSIFSVPEFKCLDKKELLKIADVLQEVSLICIFVCFM